MDRLSIVGRGAVDDGVSRVSALVQAVLVRLRAARPAQEGGQGLAEYALILAFIAIVAIAALAFFGQQLSAVLTDPVGEQLSSVRELID